MRSQSGQRRSEPIHGASSRVVVLIRRMPLSFSGLGSQQPPTGAHSIPSTQDPVQRLASAFGLRSWVIHYD